MNILRRLINKIISEEIGRNFHTIDTDPHTFESFQDYDININPVEEERYRLEIFFKDKKISGPTLFKDYDEAKNFSRQVVDKHRVGFMNRGK